MGFGGGMLTIICRTLGHNPLEASVQDQEVALPSSLLLIPAETPHGPNSEETYACQRSSVIQLGILA